ncbi:MAG: DNA replication and repair protein RecF [Flavobacteriales bacterium]|jgi:DNA replication and repair protein RecF|nr:DNA replication and repair protein RecF [Flavobacteriales bacterium]MCW8914098.1 DNA replication and repair protein RecF [Flavobacteriales bacterium]MCW8938156.1 DNA replication and repair protein RecF [Flavobacteriales bacterium]MCW8968225.1 DNA replication and repair protein RecF [Flavobacteriales bacterium]MCW8991189.1 DNA replication and repair protein RecF [Flavobacteriales bacterium]
MILSELSIINFKNYEEANLQLSETINCFLGDNGGGKTNILDAIYYLSFCKSHFNPIDSQNINHDAPFFVVEGYFNNQTETDRVYCGVKRGQKKVFKYNKKEYTKLADHIGKIPLVIITPADTSLIIDGSDVRRKFVDGIICQYDNSYLNNLLNYNKALQQRNLLLKSFWNNRNFDAASLEIWDDQLIQFGKYIHQARQEFVEQFAPFFQEYYTLLSNQKEKVFLLYDSKLNDTYFETLLQQSLEKDKATSYTNVGVHKDDLVFNIGEFPIKKFGSQGQQKTYLLALKLAQAALIQNIKSTKVTLLLDDIYDKLDNKRMNQLINIVGSKQFGQTFITDTSFDRIPSILESEKLSFKVFNVSNGKIEKQ